MTEAILERTDAADEEAPQPRPWRATTRVAFRFGFLYFGLFCLVYPSIVPEFLGSAREGLPDWVNSGAARALRPVIEGTGTRVFGASVAANTASISGDQAYFWVLVFVVLVVAVLGTVVWSALDRRRPHYRALQPWLLLFVRLCLAGQMIAYGMAKAIPTQMPPTPLSRLLEPYGNFSPMAVLWNHIGVSPQYEILLGCAELLAGVLLFVPRTALVGALLALVCTTQVFVLDMTYDVPAKILSFHLMLLCLVLLAPEAGRLANVLVLDRPTGPSTAPPLLRSPRADRIAAVMQIALGVWLVFSNAYTGWERWNEQGAGRPEPPLYGIWAVTDFSVDGKTLPPLTTDGLRWQRIVFDRDGVTVQRMDGQLVPVLAMVDPDARTVVMAAPPAAAGAGPQPLGSFGFDRPAPDRLTLTGTLAGQPVSVALTSVALDDFPVRGRGFHWVQEYPYFR
ncbi:DoxX family protein [Nocardia sp. CDC186]|uniref:DoxX family protein n=1 Tax=Nocardia implantans TaxID=3108168 RepID=A0ABU6ATS4_9NOCA|nr:MULTISPECIES: DoxX family protein [unclassified Nocardia]MBF6191221.1 DoxX family protein [Nocardia beijingensis]MEA3529220.1 DoxX family protein [Nocardia sp. CDC192]MEB3510885.1 DoxX family protein [Nocardia sp. CDC186]